MGISDAGEPEKNKKSDDFALRNAPVALCACNNAHYIQSKRGAKEGTTFTLHDLHDASGNMVGEDACNNAQGLNKEGTIKGGGVADNGVEISEAGEPEKNKKTDEFALPKAPEALCACNNAQDM